MFHFSCIMLIWCFDITFRIGLRTFFCYWHCFTLILIFFGNLFWFCWGRKSNWFGGPSLTTWDFPTLVLLARVPSSYSSYFLNFSMKCVSYLLLFSSSKCLSSSAVNYFLNCSRVLGHFFSCRKQRSYYFKRAWHHHIFSIFLCVRNGLFPACIEPSSLSTLVTKTLLTKLFFLLRCHCCYCYLLLRNFSLLHHHLHLHHHCR